MPKPGPGTYNIKTTIGEAPAHTMGSKLDMKTNADYIPGPGSYNIPGSIGTSRKHQYTMRGRNKDLFLSTTPSPVAYSPRDLSPSKSYTLTGKPKDVESRASYPGPAHYSVGDHDRVATKAPAYTMTGRGKDIQQALAVSTPGPGAYDVTSNNVNTRASSPGRYAVSLKSRNHYTPKGNNPGPGAYSLPSTFTGPSFTMRPKTKTLKSDD